MISEGEEDALVTLVFDEYRLELLESLLSKFYKSSFWSAKRVDSITVFLMFLGLAYFDVSVKWLAEKGAAFILGLTIGLSLEEFLM